MNNEQRLRIIELSSGVFVLCFFVLCSLLDKVSGKADLLYSLGES